MNRGRIYKYIDEHVNEHISKLQEIIKQPSISAENIGIRECAELIKKYFEEINSCLE